MWKVFKDNESYWVKQKQLEADAYYLACLEAGDAEPSPRLIADCRIKLRYERFQAAASGDAKVEIREGDGYEVPTCDTYEQAADTITWRRTNDGK